MGLYCRMVKVYLLLGSNEGEREGWLQKALDLLAGSGNITKRSALYQTAAWGLEDQPDFLNMAVLLETGLQPLELLEHIQQIEQQLGRQRILKWGQRTLDIDMLFYDDQVIDLPQLKVPHPHLQDRRFALAPLNEIAPELMHPVLKKSVSTLLDDCKDILEVVRLT